MKTISILVGGKSFNINCPDGQEEVLGQATALLDQRFAEIRANAPNLPYDQSVVLAALNNAVSLRHKLEEALERESALEKRLKRINALFDEMVYADE